MAVDKSSLETVISDYLRFALRLKEAIVGYKYVGSSLGPLKVLLTVAVENEYTWYSDTIGQTPLHHACIGGHLDIVKLLLEVGHPWNCLDDASKCPAEYCDKGGEVYEYILAEAVRSQMLLNVIHCDDQSDGEHMDDKEDVEAKDGDVKYLEQNVKYEQSDKLLVDDNGDAVMMQWELPLMSRHAALICQLPYSELNYVKSDEGMSDRNQLPFCFNEKLSIDDYDCYRVLNVGFGLGIVDTCIHAALVKRAEQEPHKRFIHYIIEVHPGVHHKMQSKNLITTSSNGNHPELVVVKDTWQNAVNMLLEQGLQFDGIFFNPGYKSGMMCCQAFLVLLRMVHILFLMDLVVEMIFSIMCFRRLLKLNC